MDIQSAFSSGLQGFQRASAGVTEATVNINRDTVNEQRMRNAERTAEVDAATQAAQAQQPGSQVPDRLQSLVQLNTEALNAEANVRSIRTADEMLGTLIDVTV
jgi:hypothetical protein